MELRFSLDLSGRELVPAGSFDEIASVTGVATSQRELSRVDSHDDLAVSDGMAKLDHAVEQTKVEIEGTNLTLLLTEISPEARQEVGVDGDDRQRPIEVDQQPAIGEEVQRRRDDIGSLGGERAAAVVERTPDLLAEPAVDDRRSQRDVAIQGLVRRR